MVYGLTRVLNEVDLVEGSIKRMLAQVDHVIVGAGPSTDGTTEALEALNGPVTILEDDAPSWHQREVMTEYALQAGREGAEWVVPFDLDETFRAWNSRVADALMDLPSEVLVARASNLTHCATSDDNPNELDPMTRMGWRSVEMLPLGKVACRVREDLRIDHGNHSARYGHERYVPCVTDVIEARHFPYRTPEQFIKRVQGAWPQLRDSGLPENHGAHMWGYGRVLDTQGTEGLRELFMEHMFFENPKDNPELCYDPISRPKRSKVRA